MNKVYCTVRPQLIFFRVDLFLGPYSMLYVMLNAFVSVFRGGGFGPPRGGMGGDRGGRGGFRPRGGPGFFPLRKAPYSRP